MNSIRLPRGAGLPAAAFLTAFLLNLAAGAPVRAQGTALEEVIVTAQKREQSIQDVGIAITAFSAEQMRTFAFVSNTELAAFTPGVHISGNNAGQTQQFTIRGVTQNDFADLHEGPNAVYVDDAYIATSQGQMFANFDMERVEVLKGPQGTLFGRNATGGLVHFITARPTDEFEGFVDASYGSYDSVRFEGAVSGPLSDTVRGRLAGFYNRFGPIWENIFPDQLPSGYQGSEAGAADVWEMDQFALRGQLDIDLNEGASLWLKGHYAEQNPGSGAYQNLATVAYLDETDGVPDPVTGLPNDVVNTRYMDDVDTLCEQINIKTGDCINSGLDLDFDGVRPGRNTDYFGYDDLDGEGPTTSTDHVVSDHDLARVYGFTATLNLELNDDMTLTAVSNYGKQKKRQSLDVDAGPAPQFIVMNRSSHDYFTQELRLNGTYDRMEYVVGLYYLKIDLNYDAGLADTRGSGLNVFGASPSPFGAGDSSLYADAALTSTLDTDSYSAFAQVDFHATDQLTFIAGARIIQEEKDFSYTNRLYENQDDRTVDNHTPPIPVPPSTLLPGAGGSIEFFAPHDEKPSKTLWSGKLGANFAATDDLLLYAALNRGVKAGGCNAPLLTVLTADQYCFDEEILLAYEAGFKATLPDYNVRINGSMYYYDYTDHQVFQFVGTSGAVFNVDAEYYGAELDLAATPVENLDLILGASWINAEVKDVAVASMEFRDVEPTFTPEWQFSGLARYTWPSVLLGGDLALQMDFNYVDEAYHNINNFDTHVMDSYIVGNARLDWRSPDDRLEVQFFVNNLADALYQNIGYDLASICGCDERSYGLPRWFGGRIRYDFF